ncbi:MAG: hypothetical protein KatS3mg031_1463 [Chitinophagales bacterium]|nr:MAG: hypothetical protein KatS3mg031_1463 [Chitinophagales bacterium]
MQSSFFPVMAIIMVSIATASCQKENPKQTVEELEQTAGDSASGSILVINITGIKSVKGVINVALFNSASTFNTEKAFRTMIAEITSSYMEIQFDSIPPDTYAFAVFHDENANGKLDQNVLGIPKEGFAFSNNAMGGFGPPNFSQASFFIPEKSKLTQTVSLKYY